MLDVGQLLILVEREREIEVRCASITGSITWFDYFYIFFSNDYVFVIYVKLTHTAGVFLAV